ncbi:MAG: amidohydrolase family protein [Rhodospirillaceae bacterium]|jgi:5-methylthioadenosine/S-adenosylhomocysteine deaminase|nr:amidohydrolase family protein [Rhodospirillaceae bacterium]MBT5241605.1 amidohydrolase family protein [Rhodospirillaceae bacterium]MBT5567374.1 amidohydrolase family protein [Rhodospirillaceae bacterium]MBT6089686.1 amidohydrolase family protein [Rhodospirillaceae bacterium]MBT7450296.1 amidohydrolase family protein [Rhodospirillaceae bacterium]
MTDHQHDLSGYEGACFICGAAEGEDAVAPGPQASRRSFMQAAAVSALAAGTVSTSARAQTPELPFGPSDDFVIDAGWVLIETDGALDLLRDGHVLVRNGVIEDVRAAPFTEAVPHLNLPQDILLPGFISGHTHCCSATPTRGIIEGPRSYQRPLELVEKLSDDELDALTALNLAELLRSGCTTQVEMSLTLRQAESYVRLAERWGVRGFPGSMIPNTERLFGIWFRGSDQVLFDAEDDTLAEIAANLAFGKTHMGKGDGRIQPMMSPHACDTHTPATMAALAAAAKELGTGLHIHLSQGGNETDAVRKLWGKTPTEWLESFGFFTDGPVFGAHMTGLDWATDAPILAKHGAIYSHCPSASGAGNGTQPYPEALAAGLKVNIGIDTHSNDYLEDLKLAVLYGQARHALKRELDPQGIKTVRPTVWNAVDAATRIPAQGLRRDDLGIIKPGARADMISVDVSGLLVGSGALPPEPLNNLLYANGRMVRTAMTDGRLQVHDSRFVADDEDRVLADGGKVVEKVWAQLADEGWFNETAR